MKEEDLVEALRRNLHYLPWDEHRKRVLDRWDSRPVLTPEQKARYKAQGRQTGRTTYGLLVAFAKAIQGSKQTVLIIAPNRDMGMAICHHANSLIARLGLEEWLKARVSDHGYNCVVYVDHLSDEWGSTNNENNPPPIPTELH